MLPGAETDFRVSSRGSFERRSRKFETPLPWTQLGILLVLHLAEPISASVIFPFISQLVDELKVAGDDHNKVGYYVGLVDSLFFITEAIFVLQWGRLSDKVGRRPVLLCGLLGLMMSMLSFGLSKSFVGIILSRALAGALNGNTGILKSAVGEITDESNAARAFSFIPVVWFVGVTVAPLVGGFLSHPAERFPTFFSSFWSTFPYFLPCLAAALFSLLAFLITLFFFEETHPALIKAKDRFTTLRSESEETLCDPDEQEQQTLLKKEEMDDEPTESLEPPITSLLTGRVIISVINFGFLAFLEISFSALVPLFLSSTVQLSPASIGMVLGIMGLVNGLMQIAFFVPMHSMLGTRNLMTLGVCAFVVLFATFPMISRSVTRNDGRLGMDGWFWLALQVIMCPLENMAFNCVFLYVTASAKSPSALGTTNGIAQTAASLARAIGPASATSLFALSNQRPDIANGSIVYWVFIGVTLVAIYVSRLLPERPWGRESVFLRKGEV